jgi:MFS family permease
LLRAAAFFFFASGYWALLPLIAKIQLAGGSLLYSTLLACLGVGAVAGALVLPRVHRKLGADRMVAAGTLATAAAVATLALVGSVPVAAVLCLALGASWIAVLSSLNVAAQMALPGWVKARGLSVYLIVFFGAMTLGSVFWGQVAAQHGIPAALLGSGAGLVVALIAVLRWKLPAGEALDLAPSMHWPAPVLAEGRESDRGPVMTTIEYSVDPQDRPEFLSALHELSGERRRNGAYAWGLFEDAEQPGRYLEYFQEESWLEHLRHHHRVTEADRELQERVRGRHRGETPPRVRHFLAAGRPSNVKPQ